MVIVYGNAAVRKVDVIVLILTCQLIKNDNGQKKNNIPANQVTTASKRPNVNITAIVIANVDAYISTSYHMTIANKK